MGGEAIVLFEVKMLIKQVKSLSQMSVLLLPRTSNLEVSCEARKRD